MKKTIIISVSLAVVIMFAFLPVKLAAAIILGSILLSLLFGVIFVISLITEEKMAEIEKTDPT